MLFRTTLIWYAASFSRTFYIAWVQYIVNYSFKMVWCRKRNNIKWFVSIWWVKWNILQRLSLPISDSLLFLFSTKTLGTWCCGSNCTLWGNLAHFLYICLTTHLSLVHIGCRSLQNWLQNVYSFTYLQAGEKNVDNVENLKSARIRNIK